MNEFEQDCSSRRKNIKIKNFCSRIVYRLDHSIRLVAIKFKRLLNAKGFTLIEVLAVIVILGILAGIAVPSVMATIDRAKEDVCHVNAVELEKRYEAHLVLDDVEHSEKEFSDYMTGHDEHICPIDGEIRYRDGKVECSLHPIEGEGNNTEEVEEVPYL